jgi:1,4-dihydroxy-2-naphthoyl-CoA hydrolase
MPSFFWTILQPFLSPFPYGLNKALPLILRILMNFFFEQNLYWEIQVQELSFLRQKKQCLDIMNSLIFLRRVKDMFVYRTQLRLKDTDATGVLYFSEQFKFALETLEEFLKSRGLSWKALMESSYLLPVVHAESDYFAPLTVGDRLEISLKVGSIGSSSVTFQYSFHDPERMIEVGRAKIVHVAIDKQTRTSVPIPDFLKKILESEVDS